MVDQTLDEIRQVQEINKAKKYETKKRDQLLKKVSDVKKKINHIGINPITPILSILPKSVVKLIIIIKI